MTDFSFIPAETAREASRVVNDHPPGQAVFMAGGTDLLIQRRQGLTAPRAVVYLKSAPDLSGVRSEPGGGLVLGALMSLPELARHPKLMGNYPLLGLACLAVGSPQVRHKATLGGNICLNTRCWYYNRSPFWRSEYPDCRKASGGRTCYILPRSAKGCYALSSGDTVGPLLALGARFRLVSDKGEREVEAADFFKEDGLNHLDLAQGEVLTEVALPPPRPGVFIKFRPQNNLDFATYTLSLLAPVNGLEARIVVGSVASCPLRAPKAEALWEEGLSDPAAVASQAAQELRLVSGVRGEIAFKRQVIAAGLAGLIKELDLKRT